MRNGILIIGALALVGLAAWRLWGQGKKVNIFKGLEYPESSPKPTSPIDPQLQVQDRASWLAGKLIPTSQEKKPVPVSAPTSSKVIDQPVEGKEVLTNNTLVATEPATFSKQIIKDISTGQIQYISDV